MDEVLKETGLSHYLLSVFYDFYQHRLQQQKEKEKERERLMFIVCPDAKEIYPLRKNPTELEVKSLIREAELKVPKMSHRERDEFLVSKFLGWAQTLSGHFILVYYHGLSKERKELVKSSNWSPLHKKYLGLFHSRFTKDRSLSLPLALNYLDLEESSDGKGHLSLDVRFVVNKWFESITERQREFLIKAKLYLIKRVGQNSLDRRIMSLTTQIHQNSGEVKQVKDLITPVLIKITPLERGNGKNEEEEDDDDDCDEGNDDPYEVKDEKYKRISKDEYSQRLVLHKDIHFSLHDYTECSRAAFLSKKYTHPLEYYTFDPIRLFDAAAIGFHLEGQIKRACSQIPLKYLQIVQNNDMTPILEFFTKNKNAKEDLKQYYEEYIYALLCLENTSHLPPQVSELLNVFDELTMQ